jgi:tight adherence protein B
MPARMMRVPLDLPLAHKIPVWLVLVLGIVAGLASGSFMQYFVRPSIAFVLGMAAGIFVSRFIFNWEFSRYQTALFKQLPDALELVISSTRAGLPLTEAFRAVNREMPSPTKEEFTRLTNEMTLGIAADQALMSMSARTQVNEYAIFAATVAIQLRSGGRIGESIANLSETIRQRVAMAGRAKALSAEARLSAQIMAVLPFVGGGMMSVINPGYLAPLFADPRGKTMFLIGGGLLLTGILALRQLVNGVASE